ncbi:MAG: hypothetical protein ACRD9L_05590 [Bryobacteraceae bacterium]
MQAGEIEKSTQGYQISEVHRPWGTILKMAPPASYLYSFGDGRLPGG